MKEEVKISVEEFMNPFDGIDWQAECLKNQEEEKNDNDSEQTR